MAPAYKNRRPLVKPYFAGFEGGPTACGVLACGLEINRPDGESSMQKSRVHLTIVGRVQGVYFRASALQRAKNLGLTGWVANCPDGSVEAVAEGAVAKLEQFVDWCRTGPDGAHVVNVSVHWQSADDTFRDFSIKR